MATHNPVRPNKPGALPTTLPEEEGRLAKRRRATRVRLLEAAYAVMAEHGIDASRIRDITDRADVGFGTFYNYFETKDELAGQVLDCVIDDFGRRNQLVTQTVRQVDPALVVPISMRLVVRAAALTPMWQWWALRPDLLFDRMREGFGLFAKPDMRHAIQLKIYDITLKEVDPAWGLATWMLVGGIHDIVVGARPIASEKFIVNAIMRMMGVAHDRALAISTTPLPKYPPPAIDWTFELATAQRAAPGASDKVTAPGASASATAQGGSLDGSSMIQAHSKTRTRKQSIGS